MSEVIVHIGLPKCASTTLQNRYFDNHDQIFYLGSRIKSKPKNDLFIQLFREVAVYPSKRTPDVNINDCFYTSLIYKKDLKEAISRKYDSHFVGLFYEKFIKNSLPPNQKVVVSAEGLSVSTIVPALEIAERLNHAFKRAKIIVILRNPIDWLKSRYLQMYRGIPGKIKKLPNFSDWLQIHYQERAKIQSMYQDLCWGRLLRKYSTLFGSENIKVLLFEQFVKDKQQFLSELSNFSGIDMLDVKKDVISDHLNPTITNGDVILKKLFAPKFNFLINRYSVWIFNQIAGYKPTLKIEHDILERTLEYIKPELDEIANTWHPPFQRYGYPVST